LGSGRYRRSSSNRGPNEALPGGFGDLRCATRRRAGFVFRGKRGRRRRPGGAPAQAVFLEMCPGGPCRYSGRSRKGFAKRAGGLLSGAWQFWQLGGAPYGTGGARRPTDRTERVAEADQAGTCPLDQVLGLGRVKPRRGRRARVMDMCGAAITGKVGFAQARAVRWFDDVFSRVSGLAVGVGGHGHVLP